MADIGDSIADLEVDDPLAERRDRRRPPRRRAPRDKRATDRGRCGSRRRRNSRQRSSGGCALRPGPAQPARSRARCSASGPPGAAMVTAKVFVGGHCVLHGRCFPSATLAMCEIIEIITRFCAKIRRCSTGTICASSPPWRAPARFRRRRASSASIMRRSGVGSPRSSARSPCRLIDRLPRRAPLTPHGLAVAAALAPMESAAIGVERLARLAKRPAANVRVSAPPALAAYVIAPRLAAFRRAHPDVTIALSRRLRRSGARPRRSRRGGADGQAGGDRPRRQADWPRPLRALRRARRCARAAPGVAVHRLRRGARRRDVATLAAGAGRPNPRSPFAPAICSARRRRRAPASALSCCRALSATAIPRSSNSASTCRPRRKTSGCSFTPTSAARRRRAR